MFEIGGPLPLIDSAAPRAPRKLKFGLQVPTFYDTLPITFGILVIRGPLPPRGSAASRAPKK